MQVSTFEEDLLDLSEFSQRLKKFMEVEHQFVDGSLVIALSSKFGTGKTTFLRMWKSALENGENEELRPLVISLNAWESDYYGDPLFAIVCSLIESIKKSGKSATSLIDAAKDVGWIATAVGGQIVNKFTGIDPMAAGELAEKKKAIRKEAEIIRRDTFSMYQDRKEAMGKLRAEIAKFVGASKPRVLFLVDELDRCRPDYAISYLETIKHIFDMQGAVFILAADRQQLENSAKTTFGPNLDFEEYYRTFIHREVTLPPISASAYSKLASAYANHYLERDGLRICFMKRDSNLVDKIVELIAGMKLTPRQIQEVFRILGHILETSDEKRGKLLWCLGIGSIAMAAFKVGNPRLFHLLGSQQLEPQEAIDFLDNLLGDKNIDWWFTLCLTGGGLKNAEAKTNREILRKVGLISEDQDSVAPNRLDQWHFGWSHSSKGLSQVHEKIERTIAVANKQPRHHHQCEVFEKVHADS